MKENLKYKLLLAFQEALLFNVTFHTKLVVADVRDGNKLIMWVYLDKEPTIHEKDAYYSVSAEVRGNFVEFDSANSSVHFSTDNPGDEDLRGKLVLFARCDYLDLEGNLKPSADE